MTSEVRAHLTRSRYGDAMPELAARPRVGPLLRDWRQRRRLSQLTVSELAIESFFPADEATAGFLRARSEAT